MNKKIISLVLALVMVLGTFTSVFAEAAKEATAKKEEVKKTETKKAEAGEKVEKVVGKDNKIQYVIDKKLVEGYEDGTYGLDKNIKRAEITRLLVLANGNEELSKQLQGSMKIYSDVDAKHWANGVITVGTTVPSDANGIAMLAGYPDGSFKPEKDVTYAELAKMLVVLAKKDLTADMVKNAKWASDWMTWAAQLGILNDVTVNDSDKAANRADAFTMIYNALYKMAEFKRTPANETRGIVSDLNRSKIVLNQDSKKEYTITNTTVVLDGNNTRRQLIKLNSINDLNVYAGALVRVLTNDKNEVTHIIVLGDPHELARGTEKGAPVKNNIWQGVAGNTIETATYENIMTLDKEGVQKEIKDAYATVGFNDSRTSADTITFHYGVKQADKTTLNINDKTEIYVANPYNNIMKQVKDIKAALDLIGYQNYKNYKIPNVYAGFDADGYTSNIKAYDTGRNTAKVIVFNTVTEDAGAEKYRVVESSSSGFRTTLEKADGTVEDRNNVLNKVHFAINYGDKHDVIGVRGDAIETLIDHSNLKNYPVVKVVKVLSDNNIQVIDRFNKEAVLYVGKADIFNAKQYKNLKPGYFLQFNGTKTDSNKVSELSIFEPGAYIEGKFNESGSVLNVAPGIQDNTFNGDIVFVGEKTVQINVKVFNFEKGYAVDKQTYVYDPALKPALTYAMDNKVPVVFKTKTTKLGEVEAFNFEANVAGNPDLFAHKAVADAKKEVVDTAFTKETNEKDPAKIAADVKSKIETQLNNKKVNDVKVEVELLTKATDASGKFVANDKVEFKVTLTSTKDAKAMEVLEKLEFKVIA